MFCNNCQLRLCKLGMGNKNVLGTEYDLIGKEIGAGLTQNRNQFVPNPFTICFFRSQSFLNLSPIRSYSVSIPFNLFLFHSKSVCFVFNLLLFSLQSIHFCIRPHCISPTVGQMCAERLMALTFKLWQVKRNCLSIHSFSTCICLLSCLTF